MEEKKDEKKIIFSEEIDNSINGFAVGITFMIIGIFLLFNKNYFGNEIVTTIIQIGFVIIGGAGFWMEISNLIKNEEIKGTGDFFVGLFFVIVWLIINYITKGWIWHLIIFLALIIGLYGCIRGMIEIIYSIYKKKKENKKTEKKSKSSIIKEIIAVLSAIVNLSLMILQILQIIKVI